MTTRELSDSGKGQYDMDCSRYLLWDEETGLGVLIQDEFGGTCSLEGGAYRPHLYTLSTSLTCAAIKAWSEKPDESNNWVSGWERYWWDNAEALAHSGGRRYYGKPEDALRRHIERQTAKASA